MEIIEDQIPDDILDQDADRPEESEDRSESYRLPADSELRKPWKEMNALLAIEEAKLLPLPFKARLDEATIQQRIAAKGYKPGSDQYIQMYRTMTRPVYEGLTDEQRAIGLTRCPVCRTGHIGRKTKRPCPCCGGFIFVGEQRIMGFLASLNEITEKQRIDTAMKEAVKESKARRAAKELRNTPGAKKKAADAAYVDLFGTNKLERDNAKAAGKGKRKDHA